MTFSEFVKENDIAIIISLTIIFILDVIVYFFFAKRCRAKYNINAYTGGILSFFALAAFLFAIALFINKDLLGIPALIVMILLESIVVMYNFKKIGGKKALIITFIELILSLGSFFEIAQLRAFRKDEYAQFKPSSYINDDPNKLR